MRTLLAALLETPRMARRRRVVLCATLLFGLLTAALAEARRQTITIDGVALGQTREQVVRQLGPELRRGSEAGKGLAWYQFQAGQSTTTVSFTAADRCARVRGNHLKLDGATLSLGSNRHSVMRTLGQPEKVSRSGSRELLEFDRQGATLYMVLEQGVLICLSAGRDS